MEQTKQKIGYNNIERRKKKKGLIWRKRSDVIKERRNLEKEKKWGNRQEKEEKDR